MSCASCWFAVSLLGVYTGARVWAPRGRTRDVARASRDAQIVDCIGGEELELPRKASRKKDRAEKREPFSARPFRLAPFSSYGFLSKMSTGLSFICSASGFTQ